MLETIISEFIRKQFPEIYQEEGPFFVEFLKQYYVWLETDSVSPVYQARRHMSNQDIDTTTSDFIVYFKEKYLKNIQLDSATDTPRLVKNALDLYRSKGSENAIALFFDLIFSAEAEVYYPGTDVFRASSAQWTIPYYLEITHQTVNRLLVGQAITGVNSGATAFVEKLVRRNVGGNFIEVLYISAITGTFQTGEIIKISGDTTTALSTYPTVIGSLTELSVNDGGTGFAVGDIVNLTSRTGGEAKGLVTNLESITGTVDFNLVDGGWGYTTNSQVYVSQEVINLTNSHIVSSANTSLDGKIVYVYQPLANVQWYNNTASFGVGNTVYNYYANGVLIGTNRIISAEYGTNTTTNFFLLNRLTGNNYMDPALPYYYTAGNTASFQVQNAGWVDNTASANVVGRSSNCFIYCTGNSSNFSVGANVYQISTNNQVYVSCEISNVAVTGANTFTLGVDNITGFFLTDQKLLTTTGKNASIVSLSYDIGLWGVNGTFSTANGNILYDTANTSLSNSSVSSISFGSGANTDFDRVNLLFPETVNINDDLIKDHIDETNSQNWINATSYGTTLHSANLNYLTLAQALNFQSMTLGMIPKLLNVNPGQGYSYAPFVEVVDPLVAPLDLMDFVIRFTSSTGVFVVGEELTQSINGAIGLVKFANTSEVHVRRLQYENNWAVGNSPNTYMLVGVSSGHTAYPTEVTPDIVGIAGDDAVITTKVSSSNTAVANLKVIDSGFCFRDGDDVTFTSLDNLRSGDATASVTTTGHGSGYYKTTSGFLSSNKYLYDGEFYQDFSYEIKSPVSVERYADMLKSVLHVSGTRVFAALEKTSNISSTQSVAISQVTQANTV